MANIKSSIKRIDITKRNTLRNRQTVSKLKTLTKKYFVALEKYKNAKITAIDLWNDSKIELLFNENIKKNSNLLKIKSDSIIALRELNKKKQKFNYIYIDGFHDGSHVIVDAIEAFKLLDINGIMILDDFMQDDKNISYQSYEGIFYFLELFRKEIKVLYFQNIYQLNYQILWSY